ncbi:hypothetical protein [Streptomyces sp. LUP30]|uniref:hypothetical protein n=1 Tax=Streptomyces sp. LUP30 TaxID=1890285 RepID=UPI000851ABCB|nr:hypothetical protein [Streptomyces sp. LUP30]
MQRTPCPHEQAFDDDVEPGVRGVASGQVDQADVRGAGAVAFAEDDTAEVVLADQGQAAAEPLAQAVRDRRFPRGAVTAQDNQPGLSGTRHHGAHAVDGR